MKNLLLFLLLVSSNLVAQTARLEFEAPAVYPEGIVYDAAKNLFYVSSVTEGTIGAVDASGKYTALYRNSGLKSPFGMKLSPDGKKTVGMRRRPQL